MDDPDEFGGTPVTRTGLLCTLGSYAANRELLLTKLITGDKAENIKAQMRAYKRLVTSYRVWPEPPVKLDPPVYFTPLATDEVWEFTTSRQSWRLSGRAGYALVRDGVMICDIVTIMS